VHDKSISVAVPLGVHANLMPPAKSHGQCELSANEN